jgi:hypothetical protein
METTAADIVVDGRTVVTGGRLPPVPGREW